MCVSSKRINEYKMANLGIEQTVVLNNVFIIIWIEKNIKMCVRKLPVYQVSGSKVSL